MNITVKKAAGRAAVLAGKPGLNRKVASALIVKPDLAAVAALRDAEGSFLHLPPNQVSFLIGIADAERSRIIAALVALQPAAIILSGNEKPAELLRAAEKSEIPVLLTRNILEFSKNLALRLPGGTSIHGVLVQVFGLGTLIIGESAIGKSEAALDLVLRGHKLAADDMVLLERSGAQVSGKATGMGEDLLQIRGLGIINVRALYGESATVPACRIGLVVELEEWLPGHHYTLVGLRERRHRLLGVNIPYLKLPVKPGRNMATLIEVAARNQMLKNRGVYTAREFDRSLKKRLAG